MIKKLNFLIVCADFYEDVANVMIDKAISYLDQKKYSYEINRVNGSFEIPILISMLDDEMIKNYDGIIALGCIVRGETNHFDFISSSIIDKILSLSVKKKIPIGNGILTFIHKDTKYDDFFSNKEIIFYKNINDLSEKLNKFKKDKEIGKKIAKNGKKKYFKYFNSNIVSDYIISKTFDTKPNYKFIW